MNFMTFKNEVMNYESYKKSLKLLNEEMESIIYRYGGVKGVSYDKVSVSGDPHSRERMLLEMGDKLEEIEREIDHTQIKVQDIERNIAKLPEDIQEIVKLLYIERYTLNYVGQLCGYSHNGIWARVKREVEKI